MNNEYENDEPKAGRFHEEHYDPFRKSSPTMEHAAFIMAILSLLFCWMIYLALPLAAISIILTLLSRGSGKIARRMKTTLGLATAGIIVTCSVTGTAAYRVYTNPELRAQIEAMIDYYNNSPSSTLEDLLEQAEQDDDPEEEAEDEDTTNAEDDESSDSADDQAQQSPSLEDLLNGSGSRGQSGGDYI